jgi:thiol-disulfide isomerase/thioredoxin
MRKRRNQVALGRSFEFRVSSFGSGTLKAEVPLACQKRFNSECANSKLETRNFLIFRRNALESQSRNQQMHRQNTLALGLVTLLVLVTGGVAYHRGQSPLSLLSSAIAKVTSGNSTATDQPVSSNDGKAAAEFAPGVWINSDPLTLKSLRGRVVIVDFWTFACYNCRNTLPHVKEWDARYREKGLTIVGVHSPELDEEKVLENVRRETVSLGIRYPVVTDNDYATWKAYSVEAWPTIFVLDKQGHIRWSHVGEGAYDEAEKVIQQLLAE